MCAFENNLRNGRSELTIYLWCSCLLWIKDSLMLRSFCTRMGVYSCCYAMMLVVPLLYNSNRSVALPPPTKIARPSGKIFLEKPSTGRNFQPQVQKTCLDWAEQSCIRVHFELQFLFADRCIVGVNSRLFSYTCTMRIQSKSPWNF